LVDYLLWGYIYRYTPVATPLAMGQIKMISGVLALHKCCVGLDYVAVTVLF